MKRNVLGKGIDAIISNKPVAEKSDGFMEIDVGDVYPNPYQPRKKFSLEKIHELADSIKTSGLIQPVVVYKEEEKYYLVVGERRWRAAQHLKWEKIPAIIKNYSRDETIINALVENVQREDLNAIEIAEGIELLIEQTGLKQDELSEKLGMNRTTLTNYLRLLKLPEAVKQSIISGNITPGHARAILTLEEKNDMLIALSHILQNKLSVRQTEAFVKNFNRKTKEEVENYDPNVLKTEEKLARLLSTKVKLKYGKEGNGRIEIFFNNLEEFERLYKIMCEE